MRAASLSLAALALAAAAPAMAQNLDFDQGNLSGWTTNTGNAGVSSSPYGAFAPHGGYFAYLYAGLGANVYSTLSRDFKLSAGQVVSGLVGFKSNDYMPYNDNAYLKMNGELLFYSDVNQVGADGSSGWTYFSYTAEEDGIYTLELGVANSGDNSASSAAVLDSVSAPEPASWAMMLVGFGLVGGVMRSRRTAKIRFV
jgi:hypothetical protein